MFDVIWTDHNRELVGERRARKELDSKPKKKDDAPSNRSSMSTASSSSSRHDKPSGFLGAISRIKTAQSSKSRSLTTAHSQESTGTSLKDAHSLSLTPASTWPDDRLSINDMVERRGNADAARDSYENTPDRSSRGGKSPIPRCRLSCPADTALIESIFSKWTDQTSATPASPFGGSFYEGGSKSQFIQSLGPSSYVRKTTEVVVEPRTPTDQAEQLFSGVTITSGGPLDRPPTPVSPKELLVTPIQDTAGVRFNQGDRSASPPRSGQGAHPNWTANSETSSSVMSTGTFGRRTDLVLSMPKLRFTNGNADAWRPPDAWDCPPQESKFPAIEDTISYSPNDDSTSMALDLAGMQREVKRMAAAGPRIVLLRLREEWGSSTDAALYKELEMEKKRWMLSALHNMDPPPNTGVKTEPKNQKILAFFETQGKLTQTPYTKDTANGLNSDGVVPGGCPCRVAHLPHVAGTPISQAVPQHPPDAVSDGTERLVSRRAAVLLGRPQPEPSGPSSVDRDPRSAPEYPPCLGPARYPPPHRHRPGPGSDDGWAPHAGVA